MPTKTYTELPASMLRDVNYREIVETSEDSLRWNNERTLFIVKWIGRVPSFIMASGYRPVEKDAQGMRDEIKNQGDWDRVPEEGGRR
jgi:hypothetical protein